MITVIVLVGFVLSSILVFADDFTNQVSVGNATPSLGTITINGGVAITLTEDATTTATTTVSVTDTNGCSTINSVSLDFFRSAIGTTTCDTVGEADNNNCYPVISCTATTTGNTCSGGADVSAEYDCGVPLLYYADATGAGGGYAAQNWIGYITVGDGAATTSASSTIEINSLLALNVTPSSIDYGSVPAGTDTGGLNSTTTLENTGNVDMDPDVSGTDMFDGATPLAAAQQEYSATTFTYGAGTDLSSTTPATLNITLPQGTPGTVPVTDTISWGIGVPGGTANGTYTGTTTLGAAAGI